MMFDIFAFAYSVTVQATLAEWQDFVHSSIALAAPNQKLHHEISTQYSIL